MGFEGWQASAFEAMAVPGFAARMEAIRRHVRPRLEAIARELAPGLSERVGEPLHPYVAQHARRTVNPPEDTWCAWSASARGYKKHAHFQLGIRAHHVYVQAGAIHEAPFRARLADLLLARADTLRAALPPQAEWKDEHTAPAGIPNRELTAEDLARLAAGLRRKSRGDLMVSLSWPQEAALPLNGPAFLQQAGEALGQLMAAYRLAREAEQTHAVAAAHRDA